MTSTGNLIIGLRNDLIGMAPLVKQALKAFFCITTAGVNAVHAQNLPALRQNMDYVDAHQILLNSGWQMVGTNVMQCQHGGALQRGVCNAGFTNVEGCSANGYCSYSWVNAEGVGLRTTSFGGRSSFDGTLAGWKLK